MKAFQQNLFYKDLNKEDQNQLIIAFDLETTDFERDENNNILFRKKNCYSNNSEVYPKIISIAWVLYKINLYKNIILDIQKCKYYVLNRKNVENKVNFCKISLDEINKGSNLNSVLEEFLVDFNKANIVQGYNLSFDLNVIISELHKMNWQNKINLDFKISDVMIQYNLNSLENKWLQLSKCFEKVHYFYDCIKINIKPNSINSNFDVEEIFESLKNLDNIQFHDARIDIFSTISIYSIIFYKKFYYSIE